MRRLRRAMAMAVIIIVTLLASLALCRFLTFHATILEPNFHLSFSIGRNVFFFVQVFLATQGYQQNEENETKEKVIHE